MIYAKANLEVIRAANEKVAKKLTILVLTKEEIETRSWPGVVFEFGWGLWATEWATVPRHRFISRASMHSRAFQPIMVSWDMDSHFC